MGLGDCACLLLYSVSVLWITSSSWSLVCRMAGCLWWRKRKNSLGWIPCKWSRLACKYVDKLMFLFTHESFNYICCIVNTVRGIRGCLYLKYNTYFPAFIEIIQPYFYCKKSIWKYRNSIRYSFISLFAYLLLCARQCARCWIWKDEQQKHRSCP